MSRRFSKSLLLAPLMVAAASAATNPPLDPLLADPHHTYLELRNQWVRVFKEYLGPHQTMPMHKHPGPGAVIIFLTDRNNKLTSEDGSSKTFQNHAGEVIWAVPTTHRSENLGDANFAAIQVEPKPAAHPKPFPTEATDAVTIDPAHYKVLVDNAWVRAIALTVGPHEKLKMHKHPATGAVIVHLTDQDMRQYHTEGPPHESHYKAGVVRWAEPDAAHQDENLSDKPMRLIRVELKQAQ